MSTAEILQAYRTLYRTSLRTIRYSRPARFQVRDVLRDAFRNQPAQVFNPRRIQNTLIFLEKASNYNGYEHRILKNLLQVKFWRQKPWERPLLKSNSDLAIDVRKQLRDQYNATLIMLNESLDICLYI